MRHITVTVQGEAFQATLADTEAARALAERLPLTLEMSELNGNEKYAYLDASLPTEPTRPGTIHAGDIMLFGDDCLVLFYETFSSSYRYTRLGSREPWARAPSRWHGSARKRPGHTRNRIVRERIAPWKTSS